MDLNKRVTAAEKKGGDLKWFVPLTLRLREYDERNERTDDFSNSVSTFYKMFVAVADMHPIRWRAEEEQ